tara:strand:- start:157 stop:354 length:198 start_codon:yes stop_codon:yes gene_type:complete
VLWSAWWGLVLDYLIRNIFLVSSGRYIKQGVGRLIAPLLTTYKKSSMFHKISLHSIKTNKQGVLK